MAKARQGRTGIKVKVGSHFGKSTATTCPRYDFGKHRRCTKIKREDGTRICNCRERGPPGSNKREQQRQKKREEKKTLKAAMEKGGEEESQWLPVEGAWAAYAMDGKGHHGGDSTYEVCMQIRDFGERFFLGGKARFTCLPPAGCPLPDQTFDLPVRAPANGIVTLGPVLFAEGTGLGRFVMVFGLEVKPRLV